MAKRYKRRKKRRGGGFVLSLLTFLIVAAAIITSITVFLKVANIEVTGTSRYNAAEIIETSGIKTGDNMFFVNKFDVADKILTKYPYIETIKIRRRLPDTFTFEIKERVPAGYIESDGNKWLVDSNSYLLEMIEPDSKIEVPKITGVKIVTPHAGSNLLLDNEDQLAALKEVLAALKTSELIGATQRIDMGKLYSIDLVASGRFLVNLGDSSQLTRKIEMLKAVISELADFDKGTINVGNVTEARFRPDSGIDLSEKPEPAEQKPAEEKAAEQKPAEEKPAEEKPAEQKPTEQKPAETENKEKADGQN